MEYQRRPSTISCTHSFSEPDLDSAVSAFGDYCLDNDYDQANQRFSTPLILISPGTSVSNSTASIPSLAAMATNPAAAASGEDGPATPPFLPLSLASRSQSGELRESSRDVRPKNFTLDLNSTETTDGTDRSTPPEEDLPLDASSLDRGTRHGKARCGGYENRYVNKESLAQDMAQLSTLPEFCDVTFLVGEGRQPVCGVRAILAARSR